MLVISLLLLIVLTFLAVGMYHSFRVQETMAANTKEKTRAYQVAQSAELYAEYLLTNDLSQLTQSSSCSATAPPTAPLGTICSGVPVNINPPSSSTAMKLLNGQVYKSMIPALTISTKGGSSASGGTYYDNPQFYIQYLGVSADGTGQIYQITALGYGGNSSAVAVVQSTYQITTGIKNLGGL